jgi:hypothetical protein
MTMSAGRLALLLGLFAVPALLLWAGHHLRRRPPRVRRIFWGALIGHTLAALAVLWVGMSPAAEWTGSDTVRGLIGFGGLVIGGVLGALAGLLSGTRGRQAGGE